MKYFICTILFFLVVFGAHAQKEIPFDVETYQPTQFPIYLSDSVFHVNLSEIDVEHNTKKKRSKRYYKRKSKRYQKRYSRLAQKVKKVYPYAKLAGEKIRVYNDVYLTLETKKEKKAYAQKIEDELKSEFEHDIRKMKISEGRILIKLIDREAGMSSFAIIKEFRGGFSAFFWQTVASIFGHDLKDEYDPEEEDLMIEHIVALIESKQL